MRIRSAVGTTSSLYPHPFSGQPCSSHSVTFLIRLLKKSNFQTPRAWSRDLGPTSLSQKIINRKEVSGNSSAFSKTSQGPPKNGTAPNRKSPLLTSTHVS